MRTNPSRPHGGLFGEKSNAGDIVAKLDVSIIVEPKAPKKSVSSLLINGKTSLLMVLFTPFSNKPLYHDNITLFVPYQGANESLWGDDALIGVNPNYR
ncbi:MAG: hypothetical protein WCV92_01660 [Candidatus Buchananbacteria bacterium]